MQVLNLLTMMQIDPTLFDDFLLDTRINREQVANAIILKSGQSQPRFNDTRIFKIYLNNWFSRNQGVITKLYDTTILEYNPIENYNREEEWERNLSMTAGKGSQDTTGVNNSGSENYTDTTANTTTNNNSGEHSTTTENKVSAFDSSAYEPSNQTTETGLTSENATITENVTFTHVKDYADGTNTTNTHTTNGTDTDKETYKNTTKGNIGVTTSQQMIEQERRVDLFNIYDWIAEEVDVALFRGTYNDNVSIY